MLFARAILAGEPIRVFNQGRMRRDFTYIDDIVEGVIRCLDKPASADPGFDAALPNPATSWAPHRLFNIGNSQPEELLHFITLLEKALGRTAIKHLEAMQPGDVVDQLRAGTSRQELELDFFSRASRHSTTPRSRTDCPSHPSGTAKACSRSGLEATFSGACGRD